MSQALAFMWVTKTDQMVHLKCTCHIQIWKVLLVVAEQVRSGAPVVCPEHKMEHDFSNCDTFKDMAIAFANHFPSDEDFQTLWI